MTPKTPPKEDEAQPALQMMIEIDEKGDVPKPKPIKTRNIIFIIVVELIELLTKTSTLSSLTRSYTEDYMGEMYDYYPLTPEEVLRHALPELGMHCRNLRELLINMAEPLFHPIQ